MRTGSSASLRDGNRKQLIDALRERGVASRAELARRTGPSRSTVSTIVGEMLEYGLVGERDMGSSASATASLPASPTPAGPQ